MFELSFSLSINVIVYLFRDDWLLPYARHQPNEHDRSNLGPIRVRGSLYQ